ncbi:hypothetical protein WN55_09411 [Dufourea novaeangliae]|uniref:Uncharacterized protein n=1 Tax=Dufourea novaeangliae TaxID=178035 RepID=A0A154P665_DUFNO|nr:hypothetical protein WN55_09411 [Dufourea novaeangliae]
MCNSVYENIPGQVEGVIFEGKYSMHQSVIYTKSIYIKVFKHLSETAKSLQM